MRKSLTSPEPFIEMMNSARRHRYNRQWDHAVRDYVVANVILQGEYDPLFELGEIFLQMKYCSGARYVLEEAEKRAQNPIQKSRAMYKQARAIDENPTISDYNIKLRSVGPLYALAREIDASIDENIDKDYFTLAQRELDAQNPREALSLLELHVERVSFAPKAYFNIGNVLEQLGDNNSAMLAYIRAAGMGNKQALEKIKDKRAV